MTANVHRTDNSAASGWRAVSVTFTVPTGSGTAGRFAHGGCANTSRSQSTSVRTASGTRTVALSDTSPGGSSVTMSGGQCSWGD